MNQHSILQPLAWASKVICTIVAGALLSSVLMIFANVQPAAAATNCSSSLQAKIDAAPSGGTVMADSCIYRESVVVDKPLWIIGTGETQIRGSNVWTRFDKVSSGWRSASTLPEFRSGGTCAKSTSRCLWPEQVYINGVPQQQIARGTQPKLGQFTLDGSRRIILGTDPRSKTVEVTTRTFWLRATSDGVHVDRVSFSHAANLPQSDAAVRNEGHSDFVLTNGSASWAHGANIGLSGGTGVRVENFDIHHGGQLGLHGNNGGRFIVRNAEVHHNNVEDYAEGWEAGAMKFVMTTSLLFDSSKVYANNGPGIWCDIECHGVTISNNRVYNNDSIGIFFEISDGGKIFGNSVWNNGKEYNDWVWGAGIVSSTSRNVEIHHNTVAWQSDGIAVVSQDRNQYSGVWGVHVHDNTVILEDDSTLGEDVALSWAQPYYDAGLLYEPSSDNRGWSNSYYLDAPEGDTYRFKWGGSNYHYLEGFSATPGEEDASYLTEREKDTVLVNKDIPANNELR